MTINAKLRCAVYTRKSSDEGLDQAFNSLDAQREAGEAYVKSQAAEGWRIVTTAYDDGGFSGGSMERPALLRLLRDIDAGLIDVVVVYKIDRLTRSLADFARIVERFDARGISFVSVTQAFNTTSSMGRLTLNVLLSFAQFEREVTGERIRDKIAASKAKGLWMGGMPPLGYDVPSGGTRVLRANEGEAATVREIFCRYLQTGSVHRLAEELQRDGIVSKHRVRGDGTPSGGLPFSRGALFHLLRNQLYLGKIVHKELVHDGQHPAILDVATFEAVQAMLDSHARRHRGRGARQVEKAPLIGRIFDAHGEPMSPAFSKGRSGRVYRYYVSASLQQGTPAGHDILRRVPAAAIETLVGAALARLLPMVAEPMAKLHAVRLNRNGLSFDLPLTCASMMREHLARGEIITADRDSCTISLPLSLPLRGGRRSIEAGRPSDAAPDPILITALRRAHGMVSRDRAGMPIIGAAPASPYERRLLRLALLAPDIQQDILTGRQPRRFNLEAFMRTALPLAWADQRQALGWGPIEAGLLKH